MEKAFDKMDKQIRHYLGKNNVDYALLLDGCWGCGKTFYIEKLKNEKQCRDIIYYSLNGQTDIFEIVNSLVLNIICGERNFKTGIKIFTDVVDFIKGKYDVVKIFSKFGGNTVNYIIDKYMEKISKKNSMPVIILDDLERISDKINITDLLGTIHNKFVLNNIKVIYVADTTRIDDSNHFVTEKEKYIQREISFANNKDEVLKSILYSAEIYSDDFLMILQDVFCENQENLRTVRFCIDCYLDLVKSYSKLSKAEYNSPESLFYSVCRIGKFYKKGFTDKDELEKQLETYYINSYYNKNQGSKSEYEKFTKDYGSKIVKQGFIYDLIYDGIFNDDDLKFFLRKPEYNEDPIYKLNNTFEMETSELKAVLDEIKLNLGNKKYSLRQYAYLRDSFIPNLLKFEPCCESSIYELIDNSIFDEGNKKDLEETFAYWLRDSFSRIKTANNVFEEKLLEAFEQFCEDDKKNKVEAFYLAIKDCNRNIFADAVQYNDVYSELVKREYVKKLLDLPNKSLRFFSYFVESAICNLVNAYEFYTNEISALNDIKNMCSDKKNNTDKDDVLRIESLDCLSNVLNRAIEHIERKDEI